ncbi:hypothetical protein ACIBG0_14570 [Nocardia sp. NPDC050630]|uniref:hypothetical protein n=1 Tax=Nocardia sp. NPDC050630 TaxID=3364321 RepID=UPI0037AB1E3D
METSSTAASWPATRAALRKGALLPWMALAVGIVSIPALVIFISMGDPGNSPWGHRLSAPGCIFSVILFCTGIIGGCMVWIRRRTRRILLRHPWLEYRVGHVTNGRYEWVELKDANGARISQLIVSSWVHQIGKVIDNSSSVVWFAGDPRKCGVISTPGGANLRYAYYRGDVPAGRQRAENIETSQSRHGGKDDRRYPSPRTLRRVCAFVIDWSLHFGAAAAVVIFGKGVIPLAGAAALGAWLTASFANRVILQGAFHTTVGKALFGLCVIQPGDGSFPAYGRLTKVWFMTLYFSVMLPLALFGGDGPGPDNLSDYFLPAVRRRDLRAQP